MGHAADRLAERGQLLGLQKLMVEIARLVFEALALGHVAHQRVHAQPLVLDLGVSRHLHPHERAVGATQPQQIVGGGAVTAQAIDKSLARLRVGETLDFERTHVLFRRVRRIAEHQFQVRIG